MEADQRLCYARRKLWSEVRELSLGTSGEIERLEEAPSPLRFLRDFVLPNKPCIIAHAIDHWPALSSWTNAYLLDLLRDQRVSVHFTPDGRADSPVHLSSISSLYDCAVLPSSITDNGLASEKEHSCRYRNKQGDTLDLERHDEDAGQDAAAASKPWDRNGERIDTSLNQACDPTDEFWFATAHIERLPFPEALDAIISSRHGVAYAQEQNGCFLSEYSKLADDAEVHLPWATEALGCMPEAVNLWIGNHNSITSFHKDHYENLYAVISGEKHFTLLPPTDVHRLYMCKYPSARYRMLHGKFSLLQEKPLTSVPWTSLDPYPATPEEVSLARSRFPEYFDGPSPFTCTVQAGEILYLPSMWFHHVRQSPDPEGRTIALNFWYDMQFDVKYAYYNFLESLTHDIQAQDNGMNV